MKLEELEFAGSKICTVNKGQTMGLEGQEHG